MRGRKLHPLAAMQAFHSSTVIGASPIANAWISTLWAGIDSASRDPNPIVKLPAGIRTIRGQVGQSWNRFPSLALPRDAVDGTGISGPLAAVITGGGVGRGASGGAICGCAEATTAGFSAG